MLEGEKIASKFCANCYPDFIAGPYGTKLGAQREADTVSPSLRPSVAVFSQSARVLPFSAVWLWAIPHRLFQQIASLFFVIIKSCFPKYNCFYCCNKNFRYFIKVSHLEFIRTPAGTGERLWFSCSRRRVVVPAYFFHRNNGSLPQMYESTKTRAPRCWLCSRPSVSPGQIHHCRGKGLPP